MSNYSQEQAAPAAYPPPPPNSYPPVGQAEGRYPYVAPPPMGYPTMDEAANPQHGMAETKSRGDKGFWEGCCAALCCCCLLETCF